MGFRDGDVSGAFSFCRELLLSGRFAFCRGRPRQKFGVKFIQMGCDELHELGVSPLTEG
jgi:hypothetical protein